MRAHCKPWGELLFYGTLHKVSLFLTKVSSFLKCRSSFCQNIFLTAHVSTTWAKPKSSDFYFKHLQFRTITVNLHNILCLHVSPLVTDCTHGKMATQAPTHKHIKLTWSGLFFSINESTMINIKLVLGICPRDVFNSFPFLSNIQCKVF